MKGKMIVCFSVLVFLLTTDLSAGIYSWTDENGVKQFSNTGPDQTAKDVEVHQEIKSADPAEGKNVRSDGGEWDDNAPKGNSIYDDLAREKELRKQKSEAERKQAAQEEWEQKIRAEKERLQGEIDRIQQLAVGPSLSIALKNARIKQFQDKLNTLEKSPEEYFGGKPN